MNWVDQMNLRQPPNRAFYGNVEPIPPYFNLGYRLPDIVGKTIDDKDFNMKEFIGKSFAFVWPLPYDKEPTMRELSDVTYFMFDLEKEGIRLVAFATSPPEVLSSWMAKYQEDYGKLPPFPIVVDSYLKHSWTLGFRNRPDDWDDLGRPVLNRMMYITDGEGSNFKIVSQVTPHNKFGFRFEHLALKCPAYLRIGYESMKPSARKASPAKGSANGDEPSAKKAKQGN